MSLFNRALMTALLSIIIIPEISAQGDHAGPGMAPVLPVPGYVIYNDGDTVWGKLAWSLKYTENNPVEIRFTPEGGTKQTLRTRDIRGFGNQLSLWEDDEAAGIPLPLEHYVRVPSWKKKEPVFMNRIINGRLTVYLNRSSFSVSSSRVESISKIDGIGFTWEPGKGLYVGPTYHTWYRIIEARTRYSSYFVVMDDGEMKRVDKDNYESLLTQLFGDCSALQDEFTKNPDLRKFKNFMILAEVYNQMCIN
jgi:hypothetical protein